MSGVIGAALAIGPLLNAGALGAVSFSFGLPRMMGGVIPDCAISESHSDRVIVTKHPVEQGAAISDHAYIDPPTVTLRWGWTETLRGESWALIMYDMLLRMMQQRMPIDLATGKRRYQNMVIESITENTDNWTEYALIVEITLTQVIIVATQSTSIPADAQASPQQTVAPQDTGHASPIPTSTPGTGLGSNGLGSGFGAVIGGQSGIGQGAGLG